MPKPAERDRARRAVDALLGFLFPDACVACGEPLALGERHACSACREQIRASLLPTGGLAAVGGDPPIHFALPFEGPTQALVHALKYDFRTSIARELAMVALPAVRSIASRRVDAVVPVPLHRVRHRERGFNQSELIARPLAASLGLPVLGALVRARATPSQTGLRRHERLKSIERTFAPMPPVRDRRILLVDDVVTTGATLTAAARAAFRGGAESVVALAVAASEPPPTPRPERRNRLTRASHGT